MSQYPLESVMIHGFRGLQKLRLDGLGLINVLVGENNSGKTSVLEAMSILCEPMNPYEWLAMVFRRDFGNLDENRIQSLRWCFRQHWKTSDPRELFESECEMRCQGSFPVRKLTATYKDIIGEPSPEELERAQRLRPMNEKSINRALDQGWRGAELVHFVETVAHSDQPTLFDTSGSTVLEPVAIQIWEGLPIHRQRRRDRLRIESATLTPYSYQINRLQVGYQSRQMLIDDRRTLVLELIRQFDPDVLDVEVGALFGGRAAIYLRHRRLGPAPLSVFGDAMRRAVLLASTIPILGEGSLLLIDELETGIHVSTLGPVFSWLISVARQFQMQVVATTHSLEAVDAIMLAAGSRIDDLVVFQLQSAEETQAKRLTGDLLLRLRLDRGLDVR